MNSIGIGIPAFSVLVKTEECYLWVEDYLFPQWVAEESSCNIFPMSEIHFSEHHARTNDLFRRVKRV
jgi:hypothetical protein